MQELHVGTPGRRRNERAARGEFVQDDRSMPSPSRRALLLINRHARRGSEAIDATVEVLERAGISLQRMDLPNRHEIADLIRAHASACDLVILGGGDGTMNAAAPALIDTRLPLGILPLGTANELARTLDLPVDPAAAAAIIAAGHLRRIDLGEANGVPYFNVAHVGLTTEIAHRLTSDSKKRWGKLGYAIAAWRIVRRVRPFTATVRHDGRTETFRTLQVSVGNGVFYGGGLRVAEGARPDDGRLDVYSLEARRWWKLIALLPGLKRGTHGRDADVRAFRTTEVTLTTRRPRDVDADGERITRTPAHFRVLPAAVQVFVPPPKQGEGQGEAPGEESVDDG